MKFETILTLEQKKNHYYPARCAECGWIGPSCELAGGQPLADSGDYDDVYCAKCGSVEVDEIADIKPRPVEVVVAERYPDGEFPPTISPPPEELYYVRDSRSITGNCLMFWRKNNAGYTYNLDDLRLWTKEEAFAQHRMRETDIPYPKKLIDSLAERHIDCQDLARHENRVAVMAQARK